MISKVITGSSFYGACRYICGNEERSTVIAAEGVRDYSYKLMADDFEAQRQIRPNKRESIFHGILSFYPGEVMTDEMLARIAKKYLQDLGITDTLFSVTRRNDKKHLHLHVIANLVNNKGKGIQTSYIGLKGKKTAQMLT